MIKVGALSGAKPDRIAPVCSICSEPFVAQGNDAWPIRDGRCCDPCNLVVPIARLAYLKAPKMSPSQSVARLLPDRYCKLVQVSCNCPRRGALSAAAARAPGQP
jgi:hypothetical protein